MEIYVERSISSDYASTGAGEQLSLADLAREPRARLVLEGRAGSGKSIVLRRLALACAAAVTGDPDGAAMPLSDWPAPIPLPIFLDFSAGTAVPDPATDSWALIDARLAAHDLAAYAPVVHQALHAGEALLILDGVAGGSVAVVDRLVATFPGNRFVISCRTCNDPLLQRHGFRRLRLIDLDRAHIDDMVARLLTAISRRRVTRDPAPPLNDRIADLQGRLLLDDGLRALTAEPLALAIAVVTDIGGHTLPGARAVVYQRFIDTLWSNVEAAPPAALGPLALAFHMAMADGARESILPHADVMAQLRAGLAGADDATIARVLDHALVIGLLEQVHGASGDDTLYRMPRAPLRTFLAASVLARADDFATRVPVLSGDPAWREALMFAVWQREGAMSGTAAPLLHHLLIREQSVNDASRPATARAAVTRPAPATPRMPAAVPAHNTVLLVAACLEALAGAIDDQALTSAVRQQLLAIMTDQEVAAPDRVHAGLALGRLGDPRFADLMPPLARIDAGVFVLGNNTPGYDDEGPAQRVDLPAFQIGIYPVTNYEYGRFLAAHPSHPRPRYWFDPRFNGPSQPVVGVTWHEASAYAAWLSRQLAAAGRLPAGMVVRLPLESEWEKAAAWGPRARRARRFPWGDRWETGLANIAETRTGPDGHARWATTPVGCFAGGASLYGVHDLIGNVWEWTASEYASYPGAPVPFLQRQSYVLRGSSFNSTAINARASYRGSHLPPQYWRYNLGFRIVIGRPLPQRVDEDS